MPGDSQSSRYYYADFHNYGFVHVYDNEEDADNGGPSAGYIYIDDYMMGESSTTKWCYED
jgi:hypothetical protein